MSILHICCNLAGSTVFPQLFEALRDQGLEQTVFVPEKREGDMGKNMPEGVGTHYALTVKKTDTLFFFRKAQRSVPVIEKTVDMKRVSLVHAHTLFTDGSIAYSLCRKYGAAYVVTLRYSDMEAIWRYEPHLRPMARRILRHAAKVVFLSGKARDKVLGSWLSEKDRALIAPKAVVIPNGIRPDWLDARARDALHDPVRVGFAGRLNKRKRPLDALAAVHKACESGETEFVMKACGSGELKDELVAAMHEGDSYAGQAQGMDEMKRFYADCDVLLVPSSAETFGMVYLEAMSQGVPVLYTRGQGFDGQFPEGEAGFSVVCGDIGQQAQALREIIRDYPARSARCIELAASYEWSRIAKRWAELYQEVI